MQRPCNAKIVATLGPTSADRTTGSRFRLDLERDRPGQTIVIAAGMPFGSAGTTKLLRIAQVA